MLLDAVLRSVCFLDPSVKREENRGVRDERQRSAIDDGTINDVIFAKIAEPRRPSNLPRSLVH